MKIHDNKPENKERQRQRRKGTAPSLYPEGPVLEKVCFRCKGDPQPIGNFGEAKQNKDGHKGVCKTCRAKADDEWYAEHKDESSARTKAYYKANKTRLDAENKQRNIDNREKYRPARQAGQRRRYKEDPTKVLASAKQRHAALRVEMLMAFSGFCACCGESDLRLLTFDHKDGDGADHRRKMAGSQKANAHVMLVWIKKNMDEAKRMLQVLCWTCNNGSWRNNGICPHQQEFSIVGMAMSLQPALAA